jgi:predicted PurR-regulated permease PerM
LTVPADPAKTVEWAAFWALAAALLLALRLHLFVALLTGLSAFALHRALEHLLGRALKPAWSRHLATVAMLVALALLIALAIDRLSDLKTAFGLPELLQLMADTLEKLRARLPEWLADRVPSSPDDLNSVAAHWLRDNAAQIQVWGHHTLRAIAYGLAGFVIGMLASISGPNHPVGPSTFMQAWRTRLAQLEQAFIDVVAAQLRIALINTALTAVYLVLLVPLLGWRVPLTATLVWVTFLASLLPVVGNLLSNTAIVLASLTVSPVLGALSLAFLVAIHKLEYFLNAHIVGRRIQVSTYSLLAAMLILEATFGLVGVVAAPIYVAWATRELRAQHLLL